MKDINVPFSLFDFFAILFPGLFGVVSIYLFIDPALNNISVYWQSLNNINDFILIIALVVICYFVGHIFNTLSSFFIERPATRFLGWSVNNFLATHGIIQDKGIRGFVIKDGRLKFPKRIYMYEEKAKTSSFGGLLKRCVVTAFGKINQDYGYTFRLVQAYVTQFASDSASEARVFTATAAMYKSLTVSYTLIGIALLYGVFSGQNSSGITNLITLISFVLAILCFSSSRRYQKMWVETIYAAFVAVVKSQGNTRKKT